MSNTLTGFSPAATRGQLLHIGTGVLAFGAIIRLGDGTSTPLTLSSAGLAIDGDLHVSAKATLLPDSLSGAGAIPVAKSATLYTSTGASQALSLADGTHGQIKTIVHAVDGGSGILTPTTKTGFATITFNAAGDSVTLMFLTTVGWVILASRGVTIA